MNLRAILTNLLRPVRVLPPKDAYDLWAPTYDERNNNALLIAEELAVFPLLDSLPIAGGQVVDFGCGTGRHIAHCCQRNAMRVVGIDFSRAMLIQARAKFFDKPVFLVESSINALPFCDSRFDIGIATLVLSHCKDLSLPVSEMARVLKRRAKLVVSDWHPENDRRGWKRAFSVASDGKQGARYAGESYPHSLAEYRKHFYSHGFVIKKIVEPIIDETLRPIFQRTGMTHVFDQYFDTPIVVVFVLQKE